MAVQAPHLLTTASDSMTCGIKPYSYEMNLPGMLNVITAPRMLLKEARILSHSTSLASKEKITNSTIHLLQAPILIAESICSIALNVLKFLHLVSPAIKKLTLAAGGLGGAICAIETVYETMEVARNIHFLKKIKTPPKKNWTDLSSLDKTQASQAVRQVFQKTIAQKENYRALLPHRQGRAILKQLQRDAKLSPKKFRKNHLAIDDRLKNLENLTENVLLSRTLQSVKEDYLSVSPEQNQQIQANSSLNLSQKEELRQICLQEKKNSLAGRVQIWAACEISERLPQVLRTLQKTPSKHWSKRRVERLERAQTYARKEALELIRIMKTQVQKKMIAHAIAYSAISVTVAAIGLGTAAAAPYLSLAFIISGIGLVLIRSLYIQGVCNANGWRVKWTLFIPDSLRPSTIKRRYAMIKSRTRKFVLMAMGVAAMIGAVAIRVLRHGRM